MNRNLFSFVGARFFLGGLTLLALVTFGLALWLPGELARAQDSGPIEFAENDDDGVVAVFTAVDPEMKSVTWSIPAANVDPDGAGDLTPDDNTDGTLFSIDKSSGELTFNELPDYEDPAGGTGDNSNTYEVVVQASDGTGADAQMSWKKVEVEVTNVDEDATTGIEMSSLQPQVSTPITVDYVDGVGNPLVDAAGVANMAIVDPDQDKGETSTTIPDADVEWQWSKSSSKSGTYADITEDDAAKTDTYTPVSQDRGMYLRVTATYEDGEGEGKTVVADSRYPVRALPSGNSAPAFPTDFGPDPDNEGATLTAPEAEADDGATEGDNVGDPVEANDANNDNLTYSLEADTSGTAGDADVFQIDRMTGQVTVGLGKTVHPVSDDGETADDSVVVSDANGFTVTIKATDPFDESTMVVMTITVDAVDEAPVFTDGEASHSHAENELDTEVVHTFVAYDPEDDRVIYSVSGDDAGKFSIDDSNGQLTFVDSPDFEARGSADGDNVYEVTVKAASTESGGTEKSTTVDVTVTVTNVDEPGMVSLSASQPRIGVEIRANTPEDPDGGVTGVTWQWSRADNAAFGDGDNVTKIKDATMAGYTPVAADDGKYLRVTATYTDNEGSGKTAVGVPAATDPVAKVRNLAPVFTDEDADTDGIQVDDREVAEDAAAAAPVGATVVATDTADADITDDGDILYLLSGADAASFEINSETGQISVGASAKLDHETNPAYVVTVTARDPEGLGSSVDVTIKVTDVDEAPEISGPSSEMFAEGDGVVAVFTAVDPEMKSVTWSIPAANVDPDGAGDLTPDDNTDGTLFSIDKSSGELTFNELPDYEDPAGGTGDNSNTYEVVVQASDGTGADAQMSWKKVEVEVTNVDEDATTGIEMSSLQPQVSTPITVDYVDGVGNPLVDAAGVANMAIVDPDQDKGETSTTIPDADVEWQWSKSSSKSGTYADITEDDAAKTDTYTPVSQDRGMYLRVTATYEDGEGEGKTVVADSRYPVRALPSGNSAPAFPTDFGPDPDNEGATLTAPEAEADDGATEGDNVGDPVEANDANNDNLTYSLEADTSGTAGDADVFQIDRMTGQVTVGLGKTVHPVSDDGETADDSVVVSDANGFTVTIKATDPFDESTMVVMTITVDAVDEAPVFTDGEASHSHAENELDTEVVHTFVAYDPEDDRVIYSVSGDDAGKFSIDDSNGQLTFVDSPDFEARGSADGDNVYEVTVKAASTESGGTEKSTTVDVTVTVTNVDEPGMVSLSASQPRIGVEIRANTPEDPDGGVTGVTWQWSRADNAAFGDGDNVTKIKDATMAGYTPVAADDGKYLRVTATYTDNEGSGKTAVGVPAATDPVAKVRNLAPVFTDEDADTDGIQVDDREVAEDAAAAAPVGATVVATDTADADITDDGDILYLLSGADAASFEINSETGQISVGASAKLDHETNPAYVVTVTARDPEGLGSSVDVTIKVTDVDEAPEIMLGGLAISGRTSVEYKENATSTVATYRAAGPDAASATWMLEGADKDLLVLDGSGTSVMLKFVSSPNYENAADADNDNVYMVTLEAGDGTYIDTHEVTVTVTNAKETGTATLSSDMLIVGEAVTATVTDLDMVTAGTEMWQWARADDAGFTMNAEDIAGATMASYTPVEADDGKYLRASVTYNDGYGADEAEATGAYVVTSTSNRPPAFAMATTSRDVAENSAADAVVGDPVVATDPDNDNVTYGLSGADATDFSIDNTGQITVGQGTMLDFETRTTYTVTVTATDPSGETATIEVTINVTNVGLATPYDADDGGAIDKPEMIEAINDYLFGSGDSAISKDDMIEVINLYLFG